MDWPQIVLCLVIAVLLIDKLINRVGCRSHEEDVRFAFREGRREGVQHYKEIWAIVEADFDQHHQKCGKSDATSS